MKNLEIDGNYPVTSAPDELLIPKSTGTSCFDSGFFGPVQWLERLKDHFGYRLLVLLFVVQHLLKGCVASFVGQATPYLYRSYHVPAPQMQIFGTIASLPWAMKPVIGLMSDVFPVAGYNKAPYFIATSVVGVVGFLAIGLLPQKILSLHAMVACAFAVNSQVSTCDLLSEAKYAEKIRTNPAYGPDMLTYVWSGLTVGGLLAVACSGFVIDSLGPKFPFLISSMPAAVVILPVVFGYLEEVRVSDSEQAEIRQRFLKQKEACALCLLILFGTASLTTCGLVYSDPKTNGVLAIIVAFITISVFTIVLSPTIAKFNAFSMLQSALTVSISGATFYFYTDTPKQYPEGPHFTPFFFNTVMGVSGAVFSLVGIYLYQRYMSSWRYRQLLITTNLVFSCLCAMDLVMFKRLNIQIGIPDTVFVLGSSVLESVVAQWMWMPQVVILSYLCPKGMEATMYALLAGCFNLGSAIGSNIGALLLDVLGCNPQGADGESDQFKNLWVASAIATTLPFATMLILIRLVPDAQQNEKLIGDDEGDATTGSLLRRWTARDN